MMQIQAESILQLRAAEVQPTREFAEWCDAHDPLASFRKAFAIPTNAAGEPLAYMVGNSLGLMPHAAREDVLRELDDWQRLGAEAHMQARRPWIRYHELFYAGLAQLTGALESEVVAMNTLTVNLHLLLVSFYQPNGVRRRIVMERGAFPSDRFAIHSFVRVMGGDPARDVIEVAPRAGEACFQDEDIERAIHDAGETLALVLLGGVQYYTGQVLDMARITRAAHTAGAKCGWDLAHAIGNVQLNLHEWQVDFAAWCSYKYLNGGPGAVAGAFVHQRHHANPPPRLEGWWGTNPATRFAMSDQYDSAKGADGWQLSNPPIFSLAPLISSFELFRQAQMPRLVAKSRVMTAYIEKALRLPAFSHIRLLTPAATQSRGCQLSLEILGGTHAARACFNALLPRGVVCDFRHPAVIRVAPAPLYTTFMDCWRLIEALRQGA